MREILVAGNWKMNGSAASSESLVAGIVAGIPEGDGFQLLVCPPYPYIAAVVQQVEGTGIAVGAQNVSEHEAGAYTGEVSPGMLKDIGCGYAIVGHSERRSLYGESSAQVAAKFEAAQAAGLIPILCVGETLEEREAGTTEAVIDEQLDAVFDQVGVGAMANAVIAYEPVWAIGTGKTATPEQAQDVHRHIRERVASMDSGLAEKIQILYGGSMKADNAPGLLGMSDIDGGLIGGASLKAEDFLGIAEAAARA
ncbi:MAG: triose-phosphate isomerase [Pseudomonadota bacterium]